VNDYQGLLQYGGFDANAISPTGIINALAIKGKKSNLPNITMNIAGKEQTFENVIVGQGTLVDTLKAQKAKLRVTIYYSYGTQSATQTYEIATAEIANQTNWWDDIFTDPVKAIMNLATSIAVWALSNPIAAFILLIAVIIGGFVFVVFIEPFMNRGD
jgi:hypothetical protein